jgi:hypothetical protein
VAAFPDMMRRTAVRSLTAVLVFACQVPATASADGAVKFKVTDSLGTDQVDERISVFIDGRAVGMLHVDAASTYSELSVTLPKAGSYDYALCGLLKTKATDGSTEDHVIDDGGTLVDVEGRSFAAFDAGNKLFYLRDETAGREQSLVQVRHAKVCSAAVALR